jgi:geranylgeranyl diphosphate synthase type II
MERINRRKTGALFHAALELGGLSAGADPSALGLLAAFGRAFGEAFQIADDLLDAEGSEAAVGKRVGKDADRGKLTFPTVLGVEESRRRAHALADTAAEAVAPLGETAGDLARLARWIVHRDH